MIVNYHPGHNDGDKRAGHYFSCEDCGWCSTFFRGEYSRVKAVMAAHKHVACKIEARGGRQYMRPVVIELTNPSITNVSRRERARQSAVQHHH